MRLGHESCQCHCCRRAHTLPCAATAISAALHLQTHKRHMQIAPPAMLGHKKMKRYFFFLSLSLSLSLSLPLLLPIHLACSSANKSLSSESDKREIYEGISVCFWQDL